VAEKPKRGRPRTIPSPDPMALTRGELAHRIDLDAPVHWAFEERRNKNGKATRQAKAETTAEGTEAMSDDGAG